MDQITNQPVVIDNGSGVLKAGFAGDEKPKLMFPSVIGTPKHTKYMVGAVEGDHFVGDKAEELRGLLKMRYPLEHGVVTNWVDMERVWSHAYSELRIQAEEHPVLLTEAPLNPRPNRERCAELLFETFNVPALFVSMQAVLSLYASGRTTGVVLDVGDGVSNAVPVYEGFAMPNAIQRMDLAGRDITSRLQLLLRRAGYPFHTSAETEVVRLIKEAACFVSQDPGKDEDKFLTDRTKSSTVKYKLPDGNVIELGAERFRAPELLFNPELCGEEYPGVQSCVLDAIGRADLDMRRDLYSNIVLAGGTTLLPGFGGRLLSEIQKGGPADVKIRITCPPERHISVWMGGSILGSLTTFKDMWVSRAEYEEEGVSIVHKKSFL